MRVGFGKGSLSVQFSSVYLHLWVQCFCIMCSSWTSLERVWAVWELFENEKVAGFSKLIRLADLVSFKGCSCDKMANPSISLALKPLENCYPVAIQNTCGWFSILSLTKEAPKKEFTHWFLSLCCGCWLHFHRAIFYSPNISWKSSEAGNSQYGWFQVQKKC